MDDQRRKQKAIVAICAMSFIVLAASATSPALATISQSFPDAPATAIASIATLSTLTAVPFTILSGLIAGRRIRFRTLTLVGLAIVFLGGILPYFAENIGEILVGRAILGAGTGLITPIASTLVLALFSGDDVARQFGRNGMATNVGAVLFQLIGGFLCNYSWRMPFMTYLAIIPVFLIVLLLLPEPETTGRERQKPVHLSQVLTWHVVGWGLFFASHMVFFYPFVTEMSGLVQANGFGSAATAAIILSVCTGTGVLGGYLFYRVHRACRLQTLCVGFGTCAVGYLVLILSQSVWSLLAASAVFGVGYGLLAPAFTYYLGLPLKPELRAASLSVYHIFTSLGSFGSAFVLSTARSIAHTSWDRFSFALGLVFYLLATVLSFFLGWSRKKPAP